MTILKIIEKNCFLWFGVHVMFYNIKYHAITPHDEPFKMSEPHLIIGHIPPSFLYQTYVKKGGRNVTND
jgi:hypothetical protein